MSSEKDGGPAFPCDSMKQFPTQEGMSLLDWFAGKALEGLMSIPDLSFHVTPSSRKIVASTAYDMAESMILEKSKRNSTGV